MIILQAIILSIVEGITEFLPISSTGHLILTSKVLGIAQTEFVKSFEVIIQFGAILAVILLYFNTVVKNVKIWGRTLLAFIPTGIIGFFVYDFVKASLLGNYNMVIFSLFFGGVAILLLEEFVTSKGNKIESIEQLTPARSVLVGVIQSISMVPGVSRALATIFGGLSVGLSRKSATEFSFLLAVPTMLAASGFDLIKTGYMFSTQEYIVLAVGFVGAFISAVISIKFLINFVQKHSFRAFAIYRIVLAIVFWILY